MSHGEEVKQRGKDPGSGTKSSPSEGNDQSPDELTDDQLEKVSGGYGSGTRGPAPPPPPGG